jgi:hypothetical protein
VIICPNCRTSNDEDAAVCSVCGRSLEPGIMQLAGRRSGPRPPVEVATPKTPSRAPAVMALVVVVVGVLGAGAWYLWFRPDPCRNTNFSSANFGYCLTVPEGWTAQPANIGSTVTLDQFASASRSAVVLVDAADLQQGTQLEQFSDFVRQKDQQAGLTPGPITETTVGGTPAQRWDFQAVSPTGSTYSVREVVVVRGDVGWRVQLTDTGESLDAASLAPFEQMLGSWRFR